MCQELESSKQAGLQFSNEISKLVEIFSHEIVKTHLKPGSVWKLLLLMKQQGFANLLTS
jgi:hypothetical protein